MKSESCLMLLALALGVSGASAQAPATQPLTPAKEAQPFDHGDDANATLMQFANLPRVPENPPARELAPLELKDKIYHGALINTDTLPNFHQAL